MMQLPIIRSVVAVDALTRLIETAYGLAGVRGWLIRSWDADVYEIRSETQRFIFRIYNRRTLEEISAELTFLDFLLAGGVSISVGMLMKNGEKIIPLDMPEGTRYGVLFSYAEGATLTRNPKAEDMNLLGVELGKIHTVGATLPHRLTRHTIDYEYLISHHLAMFSPYLDYRPDVMAYFHENAARLKPYLSALPIDGLCHGDVSQGNAHITADKKLTVFDFDYCGYGNFIYDVAMLLGDADYWGWSEAVKQAFLAGYESQRKIASAEWALVPAYQISRYYHSLAVYAGYVNERGSAQIPDELITRFFERTKNLFEQL